MTTDPTPERVVFNLALQDLSPTLVDMAWDGGARDPALARLLVGKHLHAIEIHLWVTAGIVTADDYIKHRNARLDSVTAIALHRAGYTSPVAQRRYRRDHWKPAEHRDWFDAGHFDLAVIHLLTDHGVTAPFARQCARADFTSPPDLIALHQAGVDPRDPLWYRHTRIDTAADVIRLHQAGIAPNMVNTVRSATGNPDPTVDEIIDQFTRIRGPSPDRVVFDLALQDLEAAQRDAWWRIGVADPVAVRHARSAGISANTARAYIAAGITGVDIAAHVRARVPPDLAKRLTAEGLTPSQQRRYGKPPAHPADTAGT